MNRRPFLRQTLDLRLSQRLALTPSLLQKIELLQLNKLELQEMLNQELVENPILEDVLEQETPMEAALDDRAAEDLQLSENSLPKGEKDSFDEIDFRYFFDEYLDTGYKNREVEDFEKPSFETFLTQAPSLEEHLNWQLGLSDAKPRIAEIAGQIIGNLNEDGYLIISLEEICSVVACTMEEAVEALELVQAMDPVGVGARDLRECLSLQLQILELEGQSCLPDCSGSSPAARRTQAEGNRQPHGRDLRGGSAGGRLHQTPHPEAGAEVQQSESDLCAAGSHDHKSG